MPLKRSTAFLTTGSLLAVLALIGCGGTGTGSSQNDPELMFVNACPDGPLKFFLNDVDKSGTLQFKTGTGFKSIAIDETDPLFDVSVEEPNRSVNYDVQARAFDKNTSTICVAVGFKNPDTAELTKRVRPTFIVPDRNPPIGNKSRLIFLHAFNRKSPFSTPALVLKTQGDTPLFQTTRTAYGSNASLDVDSGTYKFFATDDPRNNYLQAKDPDNDQVYAENKDPNKPIILAPGKIYLVMAANTERTDQNPPELVIVNVPVLDNP